MKVRSWDFWRETLRELGAKVREERRRQSKARREQVDAARAEIGAFAEFVLGGRLPKYMHDALASDKPLTVFPSSRHSRQVFDDMIDKVLSHPRVEAQADWIEAPNMTLSPEGKRTFINCQFTDWNEKLLDPSFDWDASLRTVGQRT